MKVRTTILALSNVSEFLLIFIEAAEAGISRGPGAATREGERGTKMKGGPGGGGVTRN